MREPSVSIIIPSYNAKKYIKACLDSIWALSFTDWECIVVDDGSTDGTGEFLDFYVTEHHEAEGFGRRIKIIHQTNRGVSVARNVGLENSNGKWVCFVDADDLVSCDYLSQEDISSVADIVLKRIEFLPSHTIYHEISPGIYTGTRLKEFLSTHLYLSHLLTPWSILFRRSIIKQYNIAFDSRYSFGEDTLFVESYLLHIRVLQVASRGEYLYRPSSNGKYSFPVSKAIEYMEDFAKVFFSLNVNSPEMALRVLIWHSGFCTGFHGVRKLDWYTNPSVNKLYRYAYEKFPSSMRWKIRAASVIAWLRALY